MATKLKEIHFYNDVGGGSSDTATISYSPYSGEACRLDITVTNDADDEIAISSPSSRIYMRQYPYWNCDTSYINIRGSINVGGQFSVMIPSPANAAATNWPAGWGGGLATWDIICASIQGNIVNTSDARLKEKITLIDSGIDTIMKFRPVSFYWSKDYNSSLTNQQFGFIAQDVEKFMPELVIAGSYDEVKKQEGNRSLNYIGIIPILTKAIQEQHIIIESQQEKIEKLEARLKIIEDLLK